MTSNFLEIRFMLRHLGKNSYFLFMSFTMFFDEIPPYWFLGAWNKLDCMKFYLSKILSVSKFVVEAFP